MSPVRTLVVWCHDWPVVAAGVGLHVPAAVLHGNRVLACSPAARAEGVRVGQRKREAQARCPELVTVGHDPSRDARAFEPVMAALEALTPRIELTLPGSCAFATRGPSRFFGGDVSLAERVTALVAGVLDGTGRCRVGVADGPSVAALAARQPWDGEGDDDDSPAPLVVPPGASRAFLAPLAVSALDQPTLAEVLGRLGIRTLGALADLPAAHIVGRFGAEGERAHRLAQGREGRSPLARTVPPDLAATVELDPPVERVDTVAFTAKALADDIYRQLADRGLACTCVAIVAETEHGERLERVWRSDDPFSAGAMADRVRWQLEGWLAGSAAHRPTAGVVLLRLVPEEVAPARGRQLGFWGETDDAGQRVARALARVEGLLGPEVVTVVERRGGRGPSEQVVRVPASTSSRSGAVSDGSPWPGRLPRPSPALVYGRPEPAELVDEEGRPVGVGGRGLASAEPARLSFAGGGWADIVAWAGPWPAEERWWVPSAHRRRVRFQVVTADGAAHLLTLEKRRWWLEATYD